MIRRFFQQDNMIFGVILGILLPLLTWLLIRLIVNDLMPYFTGDAMPFIKSSTVSLIAIFTNLFSMRYYLLRLKFDFTGRGILISTFVLGIVYFYFFI